MRRQTFRLATVTRTRISISNTSPARVYCSVCGCDVETMSETEARLLSRLLGRRPTLHLLTAPDGATRICRDSFHAESESW